MKRKMDSIASARATQRGNPAKEKVDDAESRELGLSLADLPSDITTHILLQLPIKSVLICRCVCSTWNALISKPHFAKLHFERAPLGVMIRTSDPRHVSRTLHLVEYQPEKFDSERNNYMKLEAKFKLPLRDARLVLDKKDETDRLLACKPLLDDEFGVVNSCNGLLCLCDPCNRDPLVVCNPVTGEFIRLPKATKTEKTGTPLYACAGLGVQPKTNEYKVIRMWNRYVEIWRDAHVREFDGVIIEMHTLGTPTWRNVGVDPRFEFDFSGRRLKFPTCVNGALHWINFDGWVRSSILCFNFESERLQSFPCPPLSHNGIQHIERITMGALGGSLYICDASFSDSVVMWVMKKYGVGESWTQVFSIATWGRPHCQRHLCWPLKHSEKGAAILEYHFQDSLIYHEAEKIGFKIVRTRSKLYEVFPYIPSLISLKDAVKGDNIGVLNVHSRCAKFKFLEEYEVLFLI